MGGGRHGAARGKLILSVQDGTPNAVTKTRREEKDTLGKNSNSRTPSTGVPGVLLQYSNPSVILYK